VTLVGDDNNVKRVWVRSKALKGNCGGQYYFQLYKMKEAERVGQYVIAFASGPYRSKKCDACQVANPGWIGYKVETDEPGLAAIVGLGSRCGVLGEDLQLSIGGTTW
jgi:hypothetical protein